MLVDAIDALDRELLGFAHPLDHQFLRGEGRRGWLYRGPDGGVLGYGYAGEAGRVGPIAVRDEALLGPRARAPDQRRRAPRRLRVLGRRGGRSGGRARAAGGLPARSVPGPAVLGSSRSPTSRATCRSGPVCCELGPGRWSGAVAHHWSRLPDPRPGGSLAPDVALLAVPADGVDSPMTSGDRRTLSPAEPNVTVAPAPSAQRSLRRRSWAAPATTPSRNGRSSSSMTSPRRIPTASWPCAMSTSSSPRATSCSSSVRRGRASRRSSSC